MAAEPTSQTHPSFTCSRGSSSPLKPVAGPRGPWPNPQSPSTQY